MLVNTEHMLEVISILHTVTLLGCKIMREMGLAILVAQNLGGCIACEEKAGNQG